MGDLVAGIAGAVLFAAVIFGLVCLVMTVTRRAAARRTAAAAAARDQWETATLTSIDGTMRVVLRRKTTDSILDTAITVATIRPDSPTWAQDLINAQAEADQRLAALSFGQLDGGTP